MKHRLVQLISKKQSEENRIISQVDIARESGVHVNTIRKWMADDVSRFDEDVIVRLCRYFKCLPDLIYIDWEDDPPNKEQDGQQLAH